MLVRIKNWIDLYTEYGEYGEYEEMLINQFKFTKDMDCDLPYHHIIEVKKDSYDNWYDVDYENGWDEEIFDIIDVKKELEDLISRDSLDLHLITLLVKQLIKDESDVTFENNKLLKYLIKIKYFDLIDMVIELNYVESTLEDKVVIRDLLEIHNPRWEKCQHLLKFVYINMRELLTVLDKDKIKIYRITKTDEEAIELVKALGEDHDFGIYGKTSDVVRRIKDSEWENPRCFSVDSSLRFDYELNSNKDNFSKDYFWIELDEYFIDILNKRKNTKVEEPNVEEPIDIKSKVTFGLGLTIGIFGTLIYNKIRG